MKIDFRLPIFFLGCLRDDTIAYGEAEGERGVFLFSSEKKARRFLSKSKSRTRWKPLAVGIELHELIEYLCKSVAAGYTFALWDAESWPCALYRKINLKNWIQELQLT